MHDASPADSRRPAGRRFRIWALALLLPALLLALPAALLTGSRPASGPVDVLQLSPDAEVVDAWPAVRLFADPGRQLGIDQILRRRDAFTEPRTPRANLGPRDESVWLRIPVLNHGPDVRWLLEVDYPPLNRIEVFVLVDGFRVDGHVMGSTVPSRDRPVRSRAHVVPLDLAPGLPYEIVLRIDTASSLVVPVRLHRESAYIASESQRIMFLGLMFGAALLMLLATLYSGFGLRDRAFLHYATLLVGVSMFFVSYSGLGHQFLWSAQTGLLDKISPVGALIGLCAACLFAIEVLAMKTRSPRIARGLQLVFALGALALAASLLGLLDYRQTALAVTVLGPVHFVLGLTASIRHALAGDRVAGYMVIGWGSFAVGSLTMALLLRGLIPADFLTQNLFQISSVVEMFAWMRVLAIRIEDMRKIAEHATVEKQALHALAHTDPLTGLPNRRGLVQALEQALPRAGERAMAAVFVIDLDGFKAVNDRFGHEGGDETLVQVGRRLRGCLRGSDVVARVGGDEFIVLAAQLEDERAALTIGQKMLRAVREPLSIGGEWARVGASIGFAIAPGDGVDAATLLRSADAAMYAVKGEGRQAVRRGAARGAAAG